MLKNEIIEVLALQQGETVSGERIAQQLHVTRAAIWKGIRELQKEGYIIISMPGKGYCLTIENDLLLETTMKTYLFHPELFHMEFHKEVTSTNDLAKERALAKKPEGTVIFSERQTQGKGRKGRSFYSPNKKGLYMSILLRPTHSIHQTLLITAAAAVAVYDAIQEVCGVTSQIKWVNDILINNKKVCGILCEGSMETDSDTFEWIVLGIGINCAQTKMPQELQSIAGCLEEYCNHPISRAHLAASILNHFMKYYHALSKREYLKTYRSASSLLHRPIRVYEGNHVLQGQAERIDDNAHLIVKTKDGTHHVCSGEVSVRKQ